MDRRGDGAVLSTVPEKPVKPTTESPAESARAWSSAEARSLAKVPEDKLIDTLIALIREDIEG